MMLPGRMTTTGSVSTGAGEVTTAGGATTTGPGAGRPCRVQFAIAFVSVPACKSFEVCFALALFFVDGAGCRPGFGISWRRDGGRDCAAGLVYPEASGTTGLAVGDATPALAWRSIRSSRPS